MSLAEMLAGAAFLAAAAGFVLTLLVWRRSAATAAPPELARIENLLAAMRNDAPAQQAQLRQELTNLIMKSHQAVDARLGAFDQNQAAASNRVVVQVRELVKENAAEIGKLRTEVETKLLHIQANTEKKLEQVLQTQSAQRGEIGAQLKLMSDANTAQSETLRGTVETKLREIQESNAKKLDEMRQTVDEKLQKTLETRLGESFNLVSQRLQEVHKGIGEMKTLTDGVGDLKRVLTNVKARGTWGEVQLAAILEQLLTPDQFERNVKTKASSNDAVEFAIRLPGPGDGSVDRIYLPIDSKFPQEDYLRLLDAVERADAVAEKSAANALLAAVRKSAKDIQDKYIDPPRTTDFAILFLPTEGLYSEVLRHPGVVEDLMNNCRVVISGPTTLSAIVNSFRLGFKTLAIEKRSSEVWTLLSAVKTEFGKFDEVLARLKKQLSAATNTVEASEQRARAMTKKLRAVEDLPSGQNAAAILGVTAESLDDEDDEA